MSAPKIYKSASGADLVFSMESETGLIITGFSRNVTTTVAEAIDKDNVVQAVAHTGIRAEISMDGYALSTSSLQVGTIIAIANDTARYGLSNGTVLINGITETPAQGDFANVSITMTQYSETLTLAS